MAQRGSGYDRIAGDHYATPSWVVDELIKVEYLPEPIWEVAPGDCHIVRALEAQGKKVVWHEGDFFDQEPFPGFCRSIVTNPPFNQAEKFIRRALKLTEEADGRVAMLLPVTFDCAKRRVDLFSKHPFKAKYILTTRIRWENIEQKTNGPSTNHAWYIWDWTSDRQPFMGWI